MARVSWTTREPGKLSPTIPAIVKPSKDSFLPPERFQDDYRKVLMTEHPHTNFWFKLLKDWYKDKDLSEDDSVWVRGEQIPIQWKSAIGNADMKTNFRCDYDVKIHRGDMLIRKDDNKIFMLDWNVQEHPINQASQTIECNCYFEFTREAEEVVDDDGYLVASAERKIIVPSIPGVAAEYTGRPDFEVIQSAVGITSGDLLTCYVQWNDTTRKLRIGDQFPFGSYMYRVENISVERVDITRTYGQLMFHGRRVAGGDLDGTKV